MPRVFLFLAVLLAASSFAAGTGGGGGTTPPPTGTVDSPSAFTPMVRGAVTGAIDGNITLIFRLYALASGCDVSPPTSCTRTLLFEETKSVVIASQNFVTGIGSSIAAGLDLALVAGKTRLVVQWFAPSSPNTSLGSFAMSSTPYALTLVPGAVVRTDSNLGLELGNSAGPALRASTTGTNSNAMRVAGQTAGRTSSTVGGAAIHGLSTATSGSAVGVTAVTNSPEGRAVYLLGEGELIEGSASETSSPVFRVDAQAKIYLNGQQLPRKGPAGNAGPNGTNGTAGTAPSGNSKTFGVLTPNSSCANVCLNGAILMGVIPAPCTLNTSGGWLERLTSSGACCVCSSTRFQ